MKRLVCFLLMIVCCCHVFAMDKLSVMLDWFVNPDHAPLLVAQEQGFFKQQGLDVTLVTPSDAADPARFAATGKVDLAITYEPQWLLQKKQGLPLAWVATLVDQPLDIIVADSSQARDVKALKGKSIGYSSQGVISNAFLNAILSKEGLTSKDVNFINVHYDLVQALLAHRVAAISGVMKNVEPVELSEKHFSYTIIDPQQYGVPSYAELIFVTQAGHEKDPRFKAFIAALKKAVTYLKKYPEQSWQQFAAANPGLNTATNHQIWLASVQYFTAHPDTFDEVRDNKLRAFLKQQKVL